MKKEKVFILLIILIFLILGIVIINYNSEEHSILMDSKKIVNSSSISMMLETGVDTGVYEVSTDTKWPSSSYTFNSTLSKCENGSTLTWDGNNNQVVFSGSVADKCYVYFDYEPIIEFYIYFSGDEYTYYAVEGMTWEEWIDTDYNTNEITMNITGEYISASSYNLQNGPYSCTSYVLITDIIIENRTYAFIMGSGSYNISVGVGTFYCYDYVDDELDESQNGSITFNVQLNGGEFTLYYVASIYLDEGSYAFAYTDEFSAIGLTLELEDTSLAEELALYVESEAMIGVTETNSTGTITYSDLDLGLYLIIQTGESNNFESVDPFLVLIPEVSGSAFVYDIDASDYIIIYE